MTFRKIHNATPEPEAQQPSSSQRIESVAAGAEAQGLLGIGIQKLSIRQDAKVQESQPASRLEQRDLISSQTSSTDLRPESKSSRYNVKDERPPNEPYFDPEFQKALRNGKHVASRIENILQTCDLAEDPDSQVYGMIKSANELKSFDAPAVCTIGIVGDSGVGQLQYLIINSLTD
jgi:hypothetical protein